MKKIILTLCLIFIMLASFITPSLKADSYGSEELIISPYYQFDAIVFTMENADTFTLTFNTLGVNVSDSSSNDRYYTSDGTGKFIDLKRSTYIEPNNITLNLWINNDDTAFVNNETLNIYMLDDITMIELYYSDKAFKRADFGRGAKLPNLAIEEEINMSYELIYHNNNNFVNVEGNSTFTSHLFFGHNINTDLNQYLQFGAFGFKKLMFRFNPINAKDEGELVLAIPMERNSTAEDKNSLSDWLLNWNMDIPSFDGGTWIADAVAGFLQAPIFGIVSIGDLLFVIVCIPLVVALLKYFAGG